MGIRGGGRFGLYHKLMVWVANPNSWLVLEPKLVGVQPQTIFCVGWGLRDKGGGLAKFGPWVWGFGFGFAH